jgi:hypothetical protein
MRQEAGYLRADFNISERALRRRTTEFANRDASKVESLGE